MRSEKFRDTQDYAYIIFEVMKCQDELRNTTLVEGCDGNDCQVDPPCADEADITEWLSKKKISFTVIDNQVNLEHNKEDLIQNQLITKSISLK